MKLRYLALLLLTFPMWGQISSPVTPVNVLTAPSGPCVQGAPPQQLATASATNGLYTCGGGGTPGQWGQTVGGGGGSGTVTSFSSGNLSPLFTTSVATSTTTPAQTFTASTAAQNAVLAGPATGGTGAYSFRALVAADIPSLSGTYVQTTPGAGVNQSVAQQSGTQLGVNTLNATNYSYASVVNFADSLGQGTGTCTFMTPGQRGQTVVWPGDLDWPTCTSLNGPTAYAYLIQASFGNAGQNLSRGGDLATDEAWHIALDLHPTLQYNPLVTSSIFTNDNSECGTNTNCQDTSKKAQLAGIVSTLVPDTLKTFATSGTQSGGTWVAGDISGSMTTTTSGATLTFSNVTTSTNFIYIVYEKCDNTSNGTASVTVNGAAGTLEPTLSFFGLGSSNIYWNNGTSFASGSGQFSHCTLALARNAGVAGSSNTVAISGGSVLGRWALCSPRNGCGSSFYDPGRRSLGSCERGTAWREPVQRHRHRECSAHQFRLWQYWESTLCRRRGPYQHHNQFYRRCQRVTVLVVRSVFGQRRGVERNMGQPITLRRSRGLSNGGSLSCPSSYTAETIASFVFVGWGLWNADFREFCVWALWSRRRT